MEDRELGGPAEILESTESSDHEEVQYANLYREITSAVAPGRSLSPFRPWLSLSLEATMARSLTTSGRRYTGDTQGR